MLTENQQNIINSYVRNYKLSAEEKAKLESAKSRKELNIFLSEIETKYKREYIDYNHYDENAGYGGWPAPW